MSPRRLLLFCALAAGCGKEAPIPEEDSLRVTVAVKEVEFGRAFPLSVVRAFGKEGAPPAWSDETLAPLAVRLNSTKRREAGGRVEEIRLHDAYAFSLKDIALPLSGELLHVRRSLDPARPGAPELPGGPLSEPRPWVTWGAAVAAALLAGTALLLRRRRRAPLPAVQPQEAHPAEVPGPQVKALERLARLRASVPAGREEEQAYHVEASALLRDYAAERFGVRAAEMTTEELLDAVPGEGLAAALRSCDLVKFARLGSTSAERGRMLDAAESFVRRTAG